MKKIAILGYSTRLPGTTDARFWADLLAGRDLMGVVEPNRWAQAKLQHPRRNHPGTSVSFAAGSLGDVSGFDAEFFRISPREATAMDPQQRLLLEMSWEALAHAGIDPDQLRGSRTGVFVGLASTDYGYRLADDLAVIGPNTATGVTASIAANRLSYVYDLRGPSMAVDTACSSALVAFHQACQSILQGESTLALTGAISLHLHPYGFLIFSQASMLSTGGRCRPFDADADGYARAEGGGIFVLKEYERARRDGDRILAVVLGTGINTDGRKSSLTIPAAEAQAALLQEVYTRAGVDPAQLAYLEAHGTGTAVGDPVEVEAIGRALGSARTAADPLLIGSVKGNLGHLETASGVPGLLKAIHALRQRELPPSVGIRRLNPRLPLTDYHLRVVQERCTLAAEGSLYIGVNSFGFGGANAHVLLQSAPLDRRRKASWPRQGRKPQPLPLLLSAHSPSALGQVAADFAAILDDDASANYARVYQANFRRAHLAEGLLLRAASAQELRQQLQSFVQTPAECELPRGRRLANARGPIFMYSGNGCQWLGMGRALLEHPVFAASLEEIDQYFWPLAGYRLRDDLAGEWDDGERYAATEFAQPALFAVQVAMTACLRAEGIEPVAVLGHSVGEVAAAWACGALSMADAVQVIYQRSHLQARTRGLGGMTAVAASGEVVAAWLQSVPEAAGVELAAWNSPRGATVVGEVAALSRFEPWLRQQGVAYKRLPIDYPFHSAAMGPIRDELLVALRNLQPRASSIPFLSVVTGAEMAGTQLDADYWWQNIRAPVRFAQVAAASLEQGNVFLELGGHPVLRGYLQDTLDAAGEDGRVVETLRRGQQDSEALWCAAGAVWLAGIARDWQHYFPKVPAPVDLPQYPWERERHWQEASAESAGTLFTYAVHPLLGHPVAQHTGEWEQELDLDRQPWLADHRVGDGVLLAGAAYAEIFLAAAREQHPQAAGWQVEELEIFAPLLLSTGTSKVLRLRVEENGWAEISARTLLEERWTRHARALLGTTTPPLSVQEARISALESFSATDHYAHTEVAGLHYGPTFQTVQGGSLHDNGLQVRLALPAAATESADFLLHPALLDGALQSVADWLVAQAITRPGWGFVPVRWERLRLYQSGRRALVAELRIRRRTPRSLLFDIDLFDETGAELVASCSGVRLRRLRLQRDDGERLRLLESIWVAQPLHPTALPPLPESAWALLSPSASSSQRFQEEYLPLLHALVDAYAAQARAESSEVSAAAIWRMLLADYPEYFTLTLAVGRWGLRQLGAGEGTEELDVQQAALDALLPVAREGYQHFLREALPAYLAQLPTARPLRIIESLHGESLLESWWPTQADPPVALAEDEADLLLALWDDGDSERAWNRLDGLAAQAAPGALLIVQGIHPDPLWTRLDGQTRLPSPAQLLARLQAQGWQPVLGAEPDESGVYVLLLRWPADAATNQPSASRLGVTLLAEDSASLVLAEDLRSALPASLPARLRSDFLQTPQASTELLWLSVAADDPSSVPRHCAHLIDLGRWAVRQQPVPRLTVLSLHGTATEVLARAHAEALRGLIRTLANEWPELPLQSIEIEGWAPNLAQWATLTAGLPLWQHEEGRIDASGQFWVTRLRESELPRPKPVADSILQLGFSQPGQLRHLQWEPAHLPALADTGVRVRVQTCGLNFRDVMYALGLLPDEALEAGFSGPGLGLEFAGTVVALGPGVQNLQIGDTVLGFAPHSFASEVQTDAANLVRLPAGMDPALAAGLPTVFFTAWYALHEMAQLQAGERVLIHGAAGGVGLAAIQIAQELGAEIFATAGSPAKRDLLRLLGVERIYDSRSLDFADAIERDTQGGGVDVILNSLSGAAIRRNLQILRPFGRFLELGKRDFYANTPMGLRPFRNNLRYFGIDADQLLALQPAHTQRIFAELMTHFADGRFFALPGTRFAATAVVDAFRYMQQARQMGKVLVDLQTPLQPLAAARVQDWPRLQLDGDAWYLITGGTAGFGLATAQRLAARGARHLLLLSRSGSMASAAEQSLDAAGIEVWHPACDVGNAAALQQVLDELRATGRPLRGIVHAAAVIEDALAEQLDRAQIERVLHPKIDGAWNLHQLTQDQPLDFFVLYSSISSVLGNPGQSAYVAANAWLESLAQSRRAAGLPGLLVGWGAIADAGYLTRHAQTADLLQQRLGAAPIRSQAALDLLEALLAADASGLTALDFDAQALRRFLPGARHPRFAALLRGLPEEDQSVDTSLLARLAELDEEAAEATLRDLIRQEVGGILRLPMEKVGPQQVLSDLGLDSLMGVELALALEERVGVKLPAFLLSEGPTPARLAKRVLQLLRAAPDNDATALQRVARQHGVYNLPNRGEEQRKHG